jgi:MFS family permease
MPSAGQSTSPDPLYKTSADPEYSYPCWIWPQLVTLGVVIGCCFAKTFDAFTALRALQGLFGTIPQVIGLPIIYDMYVPEEWPTMINIWGTCFLVGPFLGPALAGYIMEGTKDWRADFGVLAGLYAISSILVLLWGRETFYDQTRQTQQTNKLKALFGIGNTRLPKLRTVGHSLTELLRLAFWTPPLLLTGLSTLVNFTWPIGITVTFDTFIHSPPYLFGNITGASMRFAPVIGALVGFAIGYFFNRWIYYGASGTRQAHWRPEYRLHGVWFPVACLFFGLLIYGLTLANGKSWVGLAFGWCITVAGLVASTV